MTNQVWEITPEELTRLAQDLAWKEHNRYFVSEYTPYSIDDFVQELVLHVYEKMAKGFIPEKPSVAYEWMKQKTRDYWRDYFRTHSPDSETPISILSIEELRETLFDNENSFDMEDDYATKEAKRIELESGTIDLSTNSNGQHISLLSQLRTFLELEKFMPGRETEVIARGLSTKEWGGGTSQFLRDFRRRNVKEDIEYRHYNDGTLLIFIGKDGNTRGYKLVNKGEI